MQCFGRKKTAVAVALVRTGSGQASPRSEVFHSKEEGFRVWGLGFRVWGLVGFRGFGFRVWGLEFRVWGLGFEVWGLRFRVWGLRRLGVGV